MLNQATLASIQRDNQTALKFAQQAYAMAEEIEKASTLEESATEQGKLYMLLGEFEHAEEWLEVGRSLCQEQQLVHQLAMNSIYLAKLSFLQNRLKRSQKYLDEAVQILDQSIEGLDDPVEILQICSELFDHFGNEKQATIYKQKAILTLKQQSLEIEDPAVMDYYISSYRPI